MQNDKTRLVELKEKLVDGWSDGYEYVRSILSQSKRPAEEVKISSVINSNKPRVISNIQELRK